ncbi:MAG: metallophosphoesterase family protein, partial [Myxococcota bacterium]
MRWVLLALCLGLACGDDDGESADVGTDARDAGSDTATGEDAGDAGFDAACITATDAGPSSMPDSGPVAEPPVVDCGEATFPDGTGLRRWPYLQSITPTSARIAWTSTTGGDSLVRFRAVGTDEWTEVSAASEAFDTARTDDTEDYVAFDVQLTGLEASSAYCYEVVEDGTVLATGLGFRSAWTGDGADSGSRVVRMLAFGDSGDGSDNQRNLANRFMAEDYDLFLHLGDMAYGDGTFPEFEANMFSIYQDFLHRVPSWPTIGNHEDKTDRAQPYLDVYYLPEQAMRPEDQERYYSFDYGDI